MRKNYFFWVHLLKSVNSLIDNRIIEDVFTQNKDEIIIRFSEKDGCEENSLKISIRPGEEHILVESSMQAKINSVKLFQDTYGETLSGIEEIKGRRIFILRLKNSLKEFWIVPYGMHANITFRDGEKFVFFKEKKPATPWLEKTYDYRAELESNKDSITSETTFKEISTYCRIINKKLFREALNLYLSDDGESFSEILINLLYAAEQKPVFYIYYKDNYDATISLIPLTYMEEETIESYGNAQESLKAYLYYFSFRKKMIEERDKRLFKAEAELNNLKTKQSKIESINYDNAEKEKFRLHADLLKANLFRIRKGMSNIEVDNFYKLDLPKIVIPLRKNLSPEENASILYNKINDFENNRKTLEHRISNIRKRIVVQEDYISKLKDETDTRKLKKMFTDSEKSTSNSENAKNELYRGIRSYTTADGWKICVGKDDIINDKLTFKIAKNKDIWLHAHGVPGSHVVILNREKNTPVPKNIIKEAAQYAAHFSKAKNAGTVPVIYTEVKYVRKPRGAKPGTVTCQREKTVFVKPIPMP